MSRETRLLLGTALIAVLTLWLLARIRFPDDAAPATPLQPLLTQITPRPAFDDLASELAELRRRVEPWFVGAALRIGPDAALLPLGGPVPGSDPGSDHGIDSLIADPVSRLAIVRVPGAATPPPEPWRPTDLDRPRFLIAVQASAGGLTLRPMLAGPLVPAPSPLWRAPLWRLPAGSGLPAGAFLFTTDARLAGLVVDFGGEAAIVPPAALAEEVDRLRASVLRAPGYVGVEVQALTRPLAHATGASTGVVVAWIDPEGPAAGSLSAGDVIEAVEERPVGTLQQWTGLIERLPAGHAFTVRVRRGGEAHRVGVIAAPRHRSAGRNVFGLRLRAVPRAGSAVVDVQTGSAAARAGLRRGDLITRAGSAEAPSPAAVRRAFDRAPAGAAVLVAYARDGAHAVTALEKP